MFDLNKDENMIFNKATISEHVASNCTSHCSDHELVQFEGWQVLHLPPPTSQHIQITFSSHFVECALVAPFSFRCVELFSQLMIYSSHGSASKA